MAHLDYPRCLTSTCSTLGKLHPTPGACPSGRVLHMGREEAGDKENTLMLLVPLPLHPSPTNPHPVSSTHQGGGIIFLSLLKLINPP